MNHFRDRRDAGRAVAQAMKDRNYGRLDMLVLALPRGGVPVAYEVAEAFGAELDLMLVRKLGVPGHEELAMGAIASGGAAEGDPDSDKLPAPGVVFVRNEEVVRNLGIDDDTLASAAKREAQELRRREEAYRGRRRPPTLQGREVVLVDDGLATGSTMIAAVRAVKQHQPSRVVVAVPVAPASTVDSLLCLADDVVCVSTPEDFAGVGQFYDRFDQTGDEEVLDLLRRAWSDRPLGDREVELSDVDRFSDRHHAVKGGRRTHTKEMQHLTHGNKGPSPTGPADEGGDTTREVDVWP